jgi:hypothetical protein
MHNKTAGEEARREQEKVKERLEEIIPKRQDNLSKLSVASMIAAAAA